MLFVYNYRLESCFKSVETQKETFNKCREYAKEYGFDGGDNGVSLALSLAKYDDAVNEMYCEIEKEAFVYAFRLGGNIMLETIDLDNN